MEISKVAKYLLQLFFFSCSGKFQKRVSVYIFLGVEIWGIDR